MKGLGTDQLLAMKFERLPLNEKFFGIMGRLAAVFMGIVYGESGEGKTEFCIHLAIELSRFGRVDWVGYETGHAADIQDAVRRNNIKGHPFTWLDPWQKHLPCTIDFPKAKSEFVNQLFGDLVMRMSKKKSAKYWFLDSADASNFTEEQIIWLFSKFAKKKGIIFIAHGKGKEPKKAVSKAIEFYGQFGIYVKHYIAYCEKSRFGGRMPYVIWDEEAKLRNPLFFGIPPAQKVTPTHKGAKKERKKRNAKKMESDV